MRQAMVVFLATVLSLSCSDGGSGPNDQLKLNEVIGIWQFEIQANNSCSGAAGGGSIYVELSGTEDDLTNNGKTLNFVSDSWGFSPSALTTGQITGHAEFNNRKLDLRVWKGVLLNGAALDGSVDAAGDFTGTLLDPQPGFGAIFVIGSCVFTVTGHHT